MFFAPPLFILVCERGEKDKNEEEEKEEKRVKWLCESESERVGGKKES